MSTHHTAPASRRTVLGAAGAALLPRVADVVPFACGDVVRPRVPVDLAAGNWLVLRIADPYGRNGTLEPAGNPDNDLGVASPSPWWFTAA